MIPGHALLLVSLILLFVDDHQPELAHGREERRAGTDHDTSLAGPQAFPLLLPLGRTERRMKQGEPVAEAFGRRAGKRRHQSDLGHQEDRRASQLQRSLSRAEVDLGLARAGHAVQQETTELPEVQRCPNPLDGADLVGAESERSGGTGTEQMSTEGESLRLAVLAQDSETREPSQHGGARALESKLFSAGRPLQARQHLDHLAPRARASTASQQLLPAAGSQLVGGTIARAGTRAGRGRQPTLLLQLRNPLGQLGDRQLGPDLGQTQPPARKEQVPQAPIEVVPRRRESAGRSQPDPAIPPGLQLLRDHRCQDFADRGEIVLGCEPRQIEKILGQERLEVEERGNWPERDALGRLAIQRPEHADHAAST